MSLTLFRCAVFAGAFAFTGLARGQAHPEASGPFKGLGLSVGVGGMATMTSYQYSGVTGVFDSANNVVGATPPAKEGRGLFLLGGSVQLGVHYPFSPRLAFLLDGRFGYSATVASGDALPFGKINGAFSSSISGNVDYLLAPTGPWHLVGGLGWSLWAPQTDGGATAYPLKNVMGPILALGLDYDLNETFYLSGRLEGGYLRSNGSAGSFVGPDGKTYTARFSGTEEALPFSLFFAINARIFR